MAALEWYNGWSARGQVFNGKVNLTRNTAVEISKDCKLHRKNEYLRTILHLMRRCRGEFPRNTRGMRGGEEFAIKCAEASYGGAVVDRGRVPSAFWATVRYVTIWSHVSGRKKGCALESPRLAS